MSSEVLGGGQLVAHLRGDLAQVRREVFIVGPWLDPWFAALVTESVPRDVRARLLTRPAATAGDGAAGNDSAAAALGSHFERFELRYLDTLHAKTLVMDDIVWVGSANWYRYSLETARELVVRSVGPVEAYDDEVADYWDAARPSAVPIAPKAEPRETTGEIVDPIAARVLKEIPKTFVLGKKRS